MNISNKRLIRRTPWLALALVTPLLAAAGDGPTPLIDKVRNATARYIDINAAFSDQFVVGTPCVSGPDTGAMGVHLVRPDRIGKLVLDAQQPQALIYEPMTDGAMRLVGVEFIVLAQNWSASGVPALEGNLMNYIEAPNRYGLPAFWEIHVWAWEQNPKGSYADWNTHVTCAHQALPQ
jgi:hypothetical protein